jgi:hypothetical protein
VLGVRPGTWMLRCDGKGKLIRSRSGLTRTAPRRLGGHAEFSADGDAALHHRNRLARRPRPGRRARPPHPEASWPNGRPTASTRTSCCSTHEGPRHRRQRRRAAHGRGQEIRPAAHGALAGAPRRGQRQAAAPVAARRPAPEPAPPGLEHRVRRPPGAPRHRHPGRARRRRAARRRTRFSPCSTATGSRVPTRANDGIGYAGDIAAAGDGGFVTLEQPGRPGPALAPRRARPTEHRGGDQGSLRAGPLGRPRPAAACWSPPRWASAAGTPAPHPVACPGRSRWRWTTTGCCWASAFAERR